MEAYNQSLPQPPFLKAPSFQPQARALGALLIFEALEGVPATLSG